jgi:UDP-N-acetylglucosamine 2-epimerase (non-hydrolysing)
MMNGHDSRTRVLVVMGTRPEAIKMAPVIDRIGRFADQLHLEVCVSAQHREMLDQVLDIFSIIPTYDLDLMQPGQNLFDLTARLIVEFRSVLEASRPDYVLVHGDTTTTMAASIASFYHGATVCHVEAGLRTHDKRAPFPEEVNRLITDCIADHYFAPTQTARQNLLRENIPEARIIVTGNTGVDALLDAAELAEKSNDPMIGQLARRLDPRKELVLVTAHRRENHGENFLSICDAIAAIAERPNTQVVYPVHPNPNVQGPAHERLGHLPNVILIDPLSYVPFVWLMKQAELILTDSGGIQEEAPSLGTPVLVMRETTERPEAVEAGTAFLVGTDVNKIVSTVAHLLDDADAYNAVVARENPYGDGRAAMRIVDYLIGSSIVDDTVLAASGQE